MFGVWAAQCFNRNGSHSGETYTLNGTSFNVSFAHTFGGEIRFIEGESSEYASIVVDTYAGDGETLGQFNTRAEGGDLLVDFDGSWDFFSCPRAFIQVGLPLRDLDKVMASGTNGFIEFNYLSGVVNSLLINLDNGFAQVRNGLLGEASIQVNNGALEVTDTSVGVNNNTCELYTKLSNGHVEINTLQVTEPTLPCTITAEAGDGAITVDEILNFRGTFEAQVQNGDIDVRGTTVAFTRDDRNNKRGEINGGGPHQLITLLDNGAVTIQITD